MHLAQFLVDLIKEEELIDQPIQISSDDSGYGVGAFRDLMSASDPDRTLMITMNSFFTTPLLQRGLDADILTFAPIAHLAEDNFYLWVRGDQPIETIEQFVAAARGKGPDWMMGGAGVGADEILTAYLNILFGLEVSYRSTHGGGETASALLNGRLDSGLNHPQEVMAHAEAGRLRPLASFGKERSERFPDTPTLRELGQPFSYTMHRSLVGGPKMSAEAAAFYTRVFKAVVEHPSWLAYRRDNAMTGAFLSGEALRAHWREEREDHERMLRALGRLP